jgi:cytochrome c oxidase subunit I
VAGTAPVIASPSLHDRLLEIWETRPGLLGVLGTVDHKTIGKRYLVTAFGFLMLGGLEAAVMRLQLVHSNGRLLTPEQYNQLFTMHGVTMIFWYAAPVLSGFSNFLWPLLIGARDMAFPRLNAYSYWTFLLSGVFLYSSALLGQAPDGGWFAYVPLTEQAYAPGLNLDFYALGLVFITISTTAGAINFIVTAFKLRAPGMSINRIPIFMWGTTTTSFAVLFALPSLTVACVMLYLDRRFNTHFFDAAAGGHPLLWQHLFWIFGHPWVYIVVLPAMGIVSDALPVFCRRPLVAYTAVALATVTTGILGFGVWVHHMFATGLPPLAISFFSAASLAITIPSAIAVFAWIATIWHGQPVFRTPFLFMAGFVVLFVIGGVSGVATAAAAFDQQLTDTYFVVAHLHYVLIGINLFGVAAGLYFWFPKMTGRMLSERLGRWNFWIMFVGFNLAFLPMHLTGLLGMPRRVYTYPAGLGWDTLNLITTIGSFLFAAGVLLLVVNVWWSRRRGVPAGPNPWDGPTLEWAVASPPPPYNFAVIPTVGSRHPLWEDRLDEAERSVIDRGPTLDRSKVTVETSPLDAQVTDVLHMPEDSLYPLLHALAVTLTFYGLLLRSPVLGVAGGVLVIAGTIGWLWPSRRALEAAA